MKTTVTEKGSKWANKTIATCVHCKSRYYSWDSLVEVPTCPYCKRVDDLPGKSFFIPIPERNRDKR